MNKTIQIINTASKRINDEYDLLIRTVKINGVMHLQMQGRDHEIMRPTWGRGVIMTCPEDIDINSIASDTEELERYYRGYGDGCEVLDEVPEELA